MKIFLPTLNIYTILLLETIRLNYRNYFPIKQQRTTHNEVTVIGWFSQSTNLGSLERTLHCFIVIKYQIELHLPEMQSPVFLGCIWLLVEKLEVVETLYQI